MSATLLQINTESLFILKSIMYIWRDHTHKHLCFYFILFYLFFWGGVQDVDFFRQKFFFLQIFFDTYFG